MLLPFTVGLFDLLRQERIEERDQATVGFATRVVPFETFHPIAQDVALLELTEKERCEVAPLSARMKRLDGLLPFLAKILDVAITFPGDPGQINDARDRPVRFVCPEMPVQHPKDLPSTHDLASPEHLVLLHHHALGEFPLQCRRQRLAELPIQGHEMFSRIGEVTEANVGVLDLLDPFGHADGVCASRRVDDCFGHL